MPRRSIFRVGSTSLAAASCLLAALSLPLAAQPSTKQAHAVRIEGRAPRVDGRLDDAAWRSARFFDDFIAKLPEEGKTPSERTEVAFLYDDEALYVAARLHHRDPSRIGTAVTRRDRFSDAEVLAITLDTYLDRRTAYSFVVSAGGTRVDYYHPRDEEMAREFQFDPVWEAEVAIDSAGWSTEMRIPFSQLRFNATGEQVWGLGINRWMPRQNEDIYWVMVPNAETGYASRFGTLRGIAGVRPVRPLEVMPYVAAGAVRRGNANPANPFDDTFDGRVGADAKLGIGTNFTLDATVNPDFGQVEADPAEVNLSVFETTFEERRPFFTEGSQLLRANIGPLFFYSRRIGAPPHGQAEGDFVDAPKASTILGAAKLTGRMASGLSLGALASVTRAASARSYDTASSSFTRVPVEPLAGYFVLRAQQEIGRQASTLGATLTATQRDLDGDPALGAMLARSAITAGTDGRWRFKEGEYELTGWAGMSHIRGEAGAIDRLQRSSARYFQRPDADHLDYDPNRTSLSGFTASLRADKNAGRHILWGAQVITESPGFDMNDVGRTVNVDQVEYNADIQIRETVPGRLFRNWRLGFVTTGGFNYDWDRQYETFSQSTNLTFRNFWSFNGTSRIALRAQDGALTRGGPSMGRPLEWGHDARLSSSFAGRTQWRVNGGFARDDLGGWRVNGGGGLTLRPTASIQMSVDPSVTRSVSPRQYVATLAGGTQSTYGSRYVFAFIDRSTVAVRMRLNYAFTPDLSVEGYAEPFAASGRYFDHGELPAARSHALRTYGTDGTTVTREDDGSRTVQDGATELLLPNLDFNVTSFRSNLVLRWEWLPGSTLFLVWQQNRGAREALGELVRARDVWRSVRATGDDFLSVKVSYWLSLR